MDKNRYHTLSKALANGDKSLWKTIPHTDLHCHSLTSAPFETLKGLCPHMGIPPKRFKNLRDFHSFLQRNFVPLVNNIETVRRLIRASFQRLIDEGVVYTEMSFDLTVPEHLGISLTEYWEMIKEEKMRVARQLRVCVEAGLDREVNVEKLFTLFKESLRSNVVGGIDLYGNESSRPLEKYIEIYRLANTHNLKLKAHVGEIGTAEDVKRAVQKLGLQSVQHGISAAKNREVMKLLIINRVCLNICPSSNIALRIVKDLATHPMKRLFDEGVTITINSDDFSVFSKSASEELLDAFRTKTFSKAEIAEIVTNGLKQSYDTKN
jgi:adenosine deaminase